MASNDLAGKRVLVTGASGTFGRAITAELSAGGARVVGLDLHPSQDDAVPVIACDITDDDSVRQACAMAIERLGGLDVLVNNAGIGGPAPAADPPDDIVRQQLDVNLLGPWRVTAACVPALTDSKGRVVMVASRMAVMALPLAAAYGVSKRALVAYADALRLELAPAVSVTTVYPSMVKSPIHDSTAAAGLSLEGASQFEPLEGVVGTVVRACSERKPPRDIATCARVAREIFLARHLPGLADKIVLKRVGERIRAGAFDHAPIAAGMLARQRTGRS
jgi:NAD(P)-dependent dehydrogenase (short-subunit alcohol dehydrogenase family)